MNLENLYVDLKEQVDSLETRYHSLENSLHALPDGMLVVSNNGLITLFNQAAQKLLNLKDVTGQPFCEIFDDAFFGFSMEKMQPQTRRRIFLTIGEELEVEISASATEESVVILIHDRSEVAKLEESLQQKHRLNQLGEMAARLAHEIRNPLGGIEGFASLLREELQEEAHQKMARSIIDGTRCLNKLVSSILDYTRVYTFHFAPTDLVELAQEVCASMPEKTLFKSDCKSSIFSADKERFKLALLNLVSNGWEASEKPVLVHVSDGKVVIRDEGKGISKENLEKVFTPFFTTKTFGTGLGLAEAEKVITAHKGELSIESEENRGTTITVSVR